MKRKKLFIPEPEKAQKIEINENNLDVLSEIDFHGLMRSYQIVESFPTRNERHLYRVLERLFHHGYVGRNTEFDYRKHRYSGSLSFFYWLLSKGKYVLAKAERPFTGKIDYEPAPPKLQNLEHDLATTTFMVKAKMYCLRHNLRFISHYEILKDLPESPHPFKFKVNTKYLDQDVDLFIEPDKVFGIEFQDGKKKYFFLETDMGLEPLKRATPLTSSIYKKVVGYHAIQNTSLHKSQLNIPGFRVLFVTNKNALRQQNLMKTSQELKPTVGFLFAVLRKIEDPYTYEWFTGKGGHTTLIA